MRYLLSTGAATFSLAAFSMNRLLSRFSKTEVVSLDRDTTEVLVKPGQKIILPQAPRANQAIRFVYQEKSLFCPQVTSKSHDVCYSREPIVLDESSKFALVFDDQRQDWYAINLNG